MLTMTAIGDHLKAKRRRAMLTQQELAQKSGIGITTINRIETGKVEDPHFSTLRRLARALEVEAIELFGD